MPSTVFKKKGTEKMAYITSRMAGGVDYTFYKKGDNGLNIPTETISVKGGSDVIDKRTLITPVGIVTFIEDDKLEKLKTHPLFRQHLEYGAITIKETEKAAEKAGEELEKDKSSQITPEDYEKGNDKKGMIGGKKKPKSKKG